MAPAASKRALSHSQSSQSPSQGSQTRPSKRPRVRGPSTSLPATATSATATKTDAAPPAAAVRSSQSPPKAGASEEPGKTTTTPAPTRSQLPPPRKRTVHPGSLRRLSTGHPARTLKGASDPPDRTREKATLSGAKVGGKSKDLKDRVQAEELWIRRPNRKGARATTHGKQGLGYAGYLKMGVAAFVQRGCTTLTLHALGAAIPLCLSLALAIRDALPGGEPTTTGSGAPEDEPPLVQMEVRTGSKEVQDEITPDDEDDDIVYQTRTISTVSVMLSLSDPLRSSLGAAPAKDAGRFGRSGASMAASRRGRKRGGLNSRGGGGALGGGKG
ncbi:hypothetical protein BMF94_1316 [Rhodotorula taiwanensis]|uniref:Uncharacterized protein n=1 Tax=Rhodotorula taiwanensis TaxID=741276 RepID=A0A2S5BG17_9BASI|nr:hypothetical protein BMF94_1316 [Rhodotorula taiwanensis]